MRKQDGMTLIELMVGLFLASIAFYFMARVMMNLFESQRTAQLRETAQSESTLLRHNADICVSVISALIVADGATYNTDMLNNRNLGGPLSPTGANLISPGSTAFPDGFPILKRNGDPLPMPQYVFRGAHRTDAGPPVQHSFTFRFKSKFTIADVPGYSLNIWGDHFKVFEEVREGIKLFIDGACDNPL